jgi:hypothetical protein
MRKAGSLRDLLSSNEQQDWNDSSLKDDFDDYLSLASRISILTRHRSSDLIADNEAPISSRSTKRRSLSAKHIADRAVLRYSGNSKRNLIAKMMEEGVAYMTVPRSRVSVAPAVGKGILRKSDKTFLEDGGIETYRPLDPLNDDVDLEIMTDQRILKQNADKAWTQLLEGRPTSSSTNCKHFSRSKSFRSLNTFDNNSRSANNNSNTYRLSSSVYNLQSNEDDSTDKPRQCAGSLNESFTVIQRKYDLPTRRVQEDENGGSNLDKNSTLHSSMYCGGCDGAFRSKTNDEITQKSNDNNARVQSSKVNIRQQIAR